MAYMMATQFATVGLALVKQLEVVIGEELVDSLCLPLTVEDSIAVALTALKGEHVLPAYLLNSWLKVAMEVLVIMSSL